MTGKKPANHPKVQHYVPRMLLKNFGFGKKKNPKIHVFDKHRGKAGEAFPHPTAIRNVAAESGFYDFEMSERLLSAEGPLQALEDKASVAIERLLAQKNLRMLSLEERGWLSLFVASQFLRAKQLREHTRRLDEAIRDHIEKMGEDPTKVEGWAPYKDENELKTFSALFMFDNMQEFATIIANKSWILLETGKGSPFWIGDNPVVMHNDQDLGPQGNIGLAVPSIQIYLPLSTTVTLGMWCPKMIETLLGEFEEAQKELEKARMIQVLMPGANRPDIATLLAEYEVKMCNAEALKRGVEEGVPIPCSNDNVVFLNTLQSGWATRFVMSVNRDFSWVEQQLRDHPHLKNGFTTKFN